MKLSYIAALAAVTSALTVKKYQDEIADGDVSDGREIEDEMDPEDMVVDDYGFGRNWGWSQRGTTGDLLQVSQELRFSEDGPVDNQMLLYKLSKYSDTIANGDGSDDKELHEEEDANDAVVDINGSGRYRFGWNIPNDMPAVGATPATSGYLKPATHIEPFHFGTNPRDTSPNQLLPGEAAGDIGYGTSIGSHDAQATLDAMGFYYDQGNPKDGHYQPTNTNSDGYYESAEWHAPAFPQGQSKSGDPSPFIRSQVGNLGEFWDGEYVTASPNGYRTNDYSWHG